MVYILYSANRNSTYIYANTHTVNAVTNLTVCTGL